MNKRARTHILMQAAALFCGLVISIAFTGSPAQAQDDVSQIALQHPGWILVPGALVRPDCVHVIPKGASPVIEEGGDTGDVVLKGNVTAHYDPCSEDATIRFPRKSSETSVISDSTGSGLVEASYWDDTSLKSSDNMDSLTTALLVPSKPTKNGGVILLYNGISDSTGAYLFAPTLQYGKNFSEGGNYWTMITYFVTPTNTYVSSAVKVNKGDSLDMFTDINDKSGSKYDWQVEVIDETTLDETDQGPSTNTTLHWNTAIAGALDVANVSSCSEFPASKAVFDGTIVDHGFPSYNQMSPKWKGSIYSYGGPSCGFSVTAGNTSTLKY